MRILPEAALQIVLMEWPQSAEEEKRCGVKCVLTDFRRQDKAALSPLRASDGWHPPPPALYLLHKEHQTQPHGYAVSGEGVSGGSRGR